jgi:DNA-binding HxlR family transcriptional regulator
VTQAKSTTPQTDRPSATSTLSYDVYRAACPTRRVLDLIADKWTALIVGLLADRPHLFGELRSAIEGISAKVLAQKLRLLESDGLHEEGRFVKPKVAILGRGNVGGALAKGLEGAGYEVRTVGHEPLTG